MATPTVGPTPVPASNQIPLVAEWNLVSFHWPLQNPAIAAVFAANPEVTKVYSTQGETTAYALRAPDGSWGGTLTEIRDGLGYDVFATAATTVTMTPKSGPLAPSSYPLPQGWSEIGFTSTVSQMPVNTYLLTLAGKWTSLYRINPDTGLYELTKPEGLQQFTNMDVGRGYWINLREAASISHSGGALFWAAEDTRSR